MVASYCFSKYFTANSMRERDRNGEREKERKREGTQDSTFIKGPELSF